MTPALLIGVFLEYLADGAQDRHDGGNCGGQLEELGNDRATDFHDPVDDLGCQRRVL